MNIVDICILLLIAFFMWRGYANGLITSVTGLLGWIIAFVVASKYYTAAAALYVQTIPITVFQNLLGFITIIVLVLVISWGLVLIVKSMVSQLHLSIVDKVLGSLLGALKAIVVVLAVLSMAAPFAKNSQTWQQSQFTNQLLPYAPFAFALSKQLATQSMQHVQSMVQ